jgi:hypothetical protein
MDHLSFASLTRRASLLTLGTAGLGAAFSLSPNTAATKKHGKHKGKKEDPDKLCKTQVEDWTTFVATTCDLGEVCARFLTCGDPLKTCDFSGFAECVINIETGH